MRTPRLFIEAKALHQDLNYRRWTNQIMGYAAVAGVEWVVLTNGDEYRIYNAHAAVAVDEKLFRKFKLSAEDDVAEQTLPLLGRDRMEENQLQVLWKAEFVDRQVKAALDELFEAGDDTAPVKLLRRKIPGLSPAEVRASLRRAQVDVSFPVAAEPATKAAAAPPKLRLAKGSRRKRAFAGVSLEDLIREGLIRPPLDLRRTYRGVEVRARVAADGTVAADGERLPTLVVRRRAGEGDAGGREFAGATSCLSQPAYAAAVDQREAPRTAIHKAPAALGRSVERARGKCATLTKAPAQE